MILEIVLIREQNLISPPLLPFIFTAEPWQKFVLTTLERRGGPVVIGRILGRQAWGSIPDRGDYVVSLSKILYSRCFVARKSRKWRPRLSTL